MFSKLSTVLWVLTLCSQMTMAQEIENYRLELLVIGELDQKIRSEYTYWGDAIRIDKENLARLKHLITLYGFPTIPKVGVKAHEAAFLVAQHAVSDKAFMLYFLHEFEIRLGSKHITDQYYAYLLDRTNLMSERKQIYGTQGKCVEGKWQVRMLQKPKKLPELRKKIGLLPLAEFSKIACASTDTH